MLSLSEVYYILANTADTSSLHFIPLKNAEKLSLKDSLRTKERALLTRSPYKINCFSDHLKYKAVFPQINTALQIFGISQCLPKVNKPALQ